ncbi:hypothetical protein [Nonomuraea dietziae]|uniref:DNA-binding IclR family transcriptional regulator n=1 Tax=Nonomuraea dietziae TaxID=65515 RepID=A0A7W5Y553_9ACTN|nr:hypothetical protein [Nonomuraea dietziae]MBB3724593.1 DNA-binding IclR family transcriptional regulator [Nonomuraea dietziae]
MADVVANTGEGSTWAEVGHAFGWTISQWRAAINALAHQGWLRFAPAPRSLRPGARARLPRYAGEASALVWSSASR